jgi:TonB family protein
MLRRYVLVALFVVSFVSPLMDISHWFRQNKALQEAAVISVQYLPKFTITSPEAAAKTFPFELILLGIYAVIAGCFLTLLAFRLFRIIGFRLRCSQTKVSDRQAYLIPNKGNPFSFFNWIFINPAMHNPAEIHEIVTHELVHVRQYHSIDILLSELACVFCWFNPAAWMLKKEVHRNLEFLADNRTVRSGIDSRSYQLNLLRLANNPSPILIANHFRKSPLKERIIMLNKKQTSKIKLVTYTLLLPLAFIILVATNAVSCITSSADSQEPQSAVSDNSQELKSVNSGNVYTAVDEQPGFPGGTGEMMKFLAQFIRYPVAAQENGIQGRVTCSFVVDANGEITDLKVVSGVDPSLDSEAMRVIAAMPHWNPGKSQGVAVPVLYTLPVTFRLNL